MNRIEKYITNDWEVATLGKFNEINSDKSKKNRFCTVHKRELKQKYELQSLGPPIITLIGCCESFVNEEYVFISKVVEKHSNKENYTK